MPAKFKTAELEKYYGLNCVTQNSDAKALNPHTSEHDAFRDRTYKVVNRFNEAVSVGLNSTLQGFLLGEEIQTHGEPP